MASMRHYLAGHYLLQALAIGPTPAGFDGLLAKHGINLADLSRPDACISIERIESLLNSVKIDPALIGIYNANKAQLTTQGPLSILLMTSISIREAVRLTTHFSSLLTTAVTLSLKEDEQAAYLFIATNTPCQSFNQVATFYIATVIHRLAQLATSSMPDLIMELAMPEPAVLVDSAVSSLPKWQFNAPANCLVMPLSFLDLSGHFVDPIAHGIALQACQLALEASQHQASIVDKVRTRLQASAEAYPRQDELAAYFHLSRSTLKRQLAEENTSFNTLLQEARRQQAMRLLRAKDFNLQAIAEQLGYADQTNFSHAFKKWTGMTPVSYRRAQC